MEKLFFYVFATIVILGALSTVMRKNPLNCAISLIVTFIGLAGLYFLNDAPFAGALQILVYAGAIMVLVIFVIMFLNLPESQLEEERLSKPGILVSLFLLLPLTTICLGVVVGQELDPRSPKPEGFGSIEGVGKLMFSDYLFQFEVVSLLLMVAIVGSIVLAKKRL